MASSLLHVEMVLLELLVVESSLWLAFTVDPDVTMRQGSYPMRGPLPLSTGEESERETA